MSAATMNELKRLRQEREAIQQQLNAALEREAALVAHVERLASVFRRGFYSGDDHDLAAWEVEAKRVLAETPTTSLTRHTLLAQAEALEDSADDFEVHERARQCLKWKSEKLRQRANQLNEKE